MHASRLGQILVEVHRLPQDPRDLDRLAPQLHRPGIGFRNVHQRRQQCRDAVGFLDGVFERRAIAIHVGRSEQRLLRATAHARDGRAQVVRDGVERVAHAGDQPFDTPQHGVRDAAQLTQNVALIADRHPGIQPTRVGDLAQGVEQFPHRAERLPRQCAAADQSDHDDDHQQRAQQRAHIAQEALAFERGAADLEQRAVHQAFGGHLEAHGRAARRHDAPALAAVQLFEGVRTPAGGHAGQEDLRVSAHQPHEYLVLAARGLLGGNGATDAGDTGAFEAPGIVGQLHADQIVVTLAERPSKQHVGQRRDEQHADGEDRGIPERQPETERLGDTSWCGRDHPPAAGCSGDSTYPIPRLVWSSFGSKSRSIFSRRRWTSTSTTFVRGSKL